MVSLVNQNATSSLRFQDSSVMSEHRPRLLKDFLRDDCSHSRSPSSSSSNGFHMYPRKHPTKSTVLSLPSKSNKPSMVLLRTRSRKAAATTISAVHKLINVVKFFPFVSAKSPLVLRRSSKGTRSNERNNVPTEVAVKVKVKDILRWKSFRDMVEERSTTIDSSTSPDGCTTATTSSCSRRSSWCDSDFTSEDNLPRWCGENEAIWGKKGLVGEHGTDVTFIKAKGGYCFEDSEQQSPVSVLESSFGEHEGYFSPFRRSISNNIKNKRCTLTQRIEEFEILCPGGESTILEDDDDEEELNAITEKATTLLSHVKESTSVVTSENELNYHDLIMDFFVHELSTNEDLNDGKLDDGILSAVKSWLNGEFDDSYEWGLEDKREGYIKEMEKGVTWKNFRQEEEEISKELEVKVLNELIDEVLNDLLIN